MFEVGFTEILVISVLALVVLGPEKLPRVAAQIGKWVGRARAMARQFREQLEDEVQLAETNKARAKEAARAEQEASAAQTATAAASTAPAADASTSASTQNMYSGVTGEHDAHSSAPASATQTHGAPSNPGSADTTGAAASTPDSAAAVNAAAETAHSDANGPAPEPEAAVYQPPAYAHAGANGASGASAGTAGAGSSASSTSPVESHSHVDDDPPRKAGDFITHTHERGI